MRKLQLLQEHMTAALSTRRVPLNPADLHFAVPQGSVRAVGRPGLGFDYSYTAVMGVFDFAGGLDEVVVPLMLWVRRWQHDLLALSADAGGIAWEVELLDDGKADIMVRVPLSESVGLQRRADGGHDVVRVDEPMPFALEALQAEPLHAIYVNDELVAHCPGHDPAG